MNPLSKNLKIDNSYFDKSKLATTSQKKQLIENLIASVEHHNVSKKKIGSTDSSQTTTKTITQKNEWLLSIVQKNSIQIEYSNLSDADKQELDDLVFLKNENHACRELELLLVGRITPENCNIGKNNSVSNKKLISSTRSYLSRKNSAFRNNVLSMISNNEEKDLYIKTHICSMHENIVENFRTYLVKRKYPENVITTMVGQVTKLIDKTYDDTYRTKIRQLVDLRFNENKKVLEENSNLLKNKAMKFKEQYKESFDLINSYNKKINEFKENISELDKKLCNLSEKIVIDDAIITNSNLNNLYSKLHVKNRIDEINKTVVNKEDIIQKFKKLHKQINERIIQLENSKEDCMKKQGLLLQSFDEIIKKSHQIIINVDEHLEVSWIKNIINWIKNEDAEDPFKNINFNYVDELDKIIEENNSKFWDNIQDFTIDTKSKIFDYISKFGCIVAKASVIGCIATGIFYGLGVIALGSTLILGGIFGIVGLGSYGVYKLFNQSKETSVSITKVKMPITQVLENAIEAHSEIIQLSDDFGKFVNNAQVQKENYNKFYQSDEDNYKEIMKDNKKYETERKKFVDSWIQKVPKKYQIEFIQKHIDLAIQAGPNSNSDILLFSAWLTKIYECSSGTTKKQEYDIFMSNVRFKLTSNESSIKLFEQLTIYFDNLCLGFSRDGDENRNLLNSLIYNIWKDDNIEDKKLLLNKHKEKITNLINTIFNLWKNGTKANNINILNKNDQTVEIFDLMNSDVDEYLTIKNTYNALIEKQKKLQQQKETIINNLQHCRLYGDDAQNILNLVSPLENHAHSNIDIGGSNKLNKEIEQYNIELNSQSQQIENYNKLYKITKEYLGLDKKAEELNQQILTETKIYDQKIKYYKELCVNNLKVANFTNHPPEKSDYVSFMAKKNIGDISEKTKRLKTIITKQVSHLTNLKSEQNDLNDLIQNVEKQITTKLTTYLETNNINGMDNIPDIKKFMLNASSEDLCLYGLIGNLYKTYQEKIKSENKTGNSQQVFDIEYLKSQIQHRFSKSNTENLLKAMDNVNCYIKLDQQLEKLLDSISKVIPKLELSSSPKECSTSTLNKQLLKIEQIQQYKESLNNFFNNLINEGNKKLTENQENIIDKFITHPTTLKVKEKKYFLQDNKREVNNGLFDIVVSNEEKHEKISMLDIENQFKNLETSLNKVSITQTNLQINSNSSKNLNGVDNKNIDTLNISEAKKNLLELFNQIQLSAEMDISSTTLGFPSPSTMSWYARALFHIKPQGYSVENKSLKNILSDKQYTGGNFKNIFEIDYYKAWNSKDYKKIQEILELMNKTLYVINISLAEFNASKFLDIDIKNAMFTTFATMYNTPQNKSISEKPKIFENTINDIFSLTRASLDSVKFEQIVANMSKNLDSKVLLSSENSLRMLLDKTSTILNYGLSFSNSSNKTSIAYVKYLEGSNLEQKSLEQSLSIFVNFVYNYFEDIESRQEQKKSINYNEQLFVSYLHKLVSVLNENWEFCDKSNIIATQVEDYKIRSGKFQGFWGELKQFIHKKLNPNNTSHDKQNDINILDKYIKVNSFDDVKHNIKSQDDTLNDQFMQLVSGISMVKIKYKNDKTIADNFAQNVYDTMFNNLKTFTSNELIFSSSIKMKSFGMKSLQISTMLSIFLKKHYDYSKLVNPENKILERDFYQIKLLSLFGSSLRDSMNYKNGKRIPKIYTMTLQILGDTRDSLLKNFDFSPVIDGCIVPKYMVNNTMQTYRKFDTLCKLIWESTFKKDGTQDSIKVYENMIDMYELNFLMKEIKAKEVGGYNVT